MKAVILARGLGKRMRQADRDASVDARQSAVADQGIKAMIPIGPLVGRMMGQPPNLRELISSADGVTFWAKHDKAIAELGYSPRGLEQGMRDTLSSTGKV